MTEIHQKEIVARLTVVLGTASARISDVSQKQGALTVIVEADPADGTALEPLRQRVQAAAEALPGVKDVRVVLTAERKAPPALAVKKPSGGGMKPLHKISSRPVAPGVKHMIAVASGKGGVGKSTVAIGLARAFAAMGRKVGLLDADIYGASQTMMTGLFARPETNDDEMIVPPEKDGLRVMSMGFFVERGAPIIWRGPMVHAAIQQLLRDVVWGDLDILVIDLPPGTGDAQLSLAQYVPLSGAVIVSTPQDVALIEAEKGLKMFEKTDVPVCGMVENMSYHTCTHCGERAEIFGHGGVAQAAERLGVPFLGEIPMLESLRRHADAGTADMAVMEIFKNIAARVWMALPAQRPAQRAIKTR